MPDSSSPAHDVSSRDPVTTGSGTRAPGAVRLLCVLVAAEGAVLAAAGLWQTVQAFIADHVMPIGAIVLMGLMYLGYGLWLLLASRAIGRGSLWPRALVLLTQVFLVVVCLQLVSLWSWAWAVAGVVYAVVTVLVLFAPAVQRYLLASHAARASSAGKDGERWGEPRDGARRNS